MEILLRSESSYISDRKSSYSLRLPKAWFLYVTRSSTVFPNMHQINQLQNVQKAAALVIARVPLRKDDHITATLTQDASLVASTTKNNLRLTWCVYV